MIERKCRKVDLSGKLAWFVGSKISVPLRIGAVAKIPRPLFGEMSTLNGINHPESGSDEFDDVKNVERFWPTEATYALRRSDHAFWVWILGGSLRRRSHPEGMRLNFSWKSMAAERTKEEARNTAEMTMLLAITVMVG